ncbi:MAG: hypothetical protein K6G88_13390 [Lachnospiraceae bacterium]|nr:hypothetical protein [Lachnospiraceae bacterium]
MNTVKYLKLAGLNLAIVFSAVICYSPGLLDLRPSDPGVIRPGMSIFLALVLLFAFFYGNHELLSDPKRTRVSTDTIDDIKKAGTVLKSYFTSRPLGDTARTASEQLRRMDNLFANTENIIGEKFEKGSLSWGKYDAIVKSAEKSAVSNVVAMANRMQIFADRDYEKLARYKEDTIPDDIQQKQLQLYEDNLKKIKEAIALNEELLLKIETLMFELSSENNNEEHDEILEEIEKLTQEVKLYS